MIPPMFFPYMFFAWITWCVNLITISLIPLHNPSRWSIFLRSIIGVSIFNLILWLGSPKVVSIFKNSRVITSKASLPSASNLSIESELKYSLSSPTKHMKLSLLLTLNLICIPNFLIFYYLKLIIKYIDWWHPQSWLFLPK